MSEIATVAGLSAAVVVVWMLGLWLVSIRVGDVTFVDAGWAAGFVLVAVATALVAGGDPTRQRLLVGITAVWGVRLGVHLLVRWRRQGPDRRYVAMLRRAEGSRHLVTLRKVFLFQAPLLWVVSLPVQLGQVEATPSGLTPWGIAGSVLCAVGIAFEAVGDLQLTRFKGDPVNDGRVLDTGLWRFTRHPNYFGDTCVWWGLWLVGLTGVPGLVAVVGPMLLTFLLLRWSGVALVERHLHRSRPGYDAYVRRTSAFLPWPPRSVRETAT